MIELIDEIGREHIVALRELAKAEQRPGCHAVIVDSKLPAAERKRALADGLASYSNPDPVGLTSDVRGVLMAHGLAEMGSL